MSKRYEDGEAVRINNHKLREHDVVGRIEFYDEATQWYWVELTRGPPWRGKYEHDELVPAEVA